MNLDFSDMTPTQIYHCLVQTVLPRPVAWIMTEQENGKKNLAPFSFFAPVCSNPPTMVVSIGNKSAEQSKDTFANLQRSQRCVLHIASMAQLEALNSSAATLADDESEVEKLGLKVETFGEHNIGRIEGAPVAFECRLQQVVELGPAPQHIVFLEIERAWLDDTVAQEVNGRLTVSAEQLDPVARLGGTEYAALGDLFSLPRPQ
ncbi:flavin reductase family protein [Bacterioplanoides sp. SCSIO 12839]|uniref:flavin reductase family protein n=1 Tax=Bacterioplanoides sp. SCSIO 12839 TaxID=2829569 RepID=UPI00210494DE|nr:flavin reductase family protein [Bacterioplanoides sp. SCSIO 12839]UTW49277.1 flavin reductase family protein [Bacterioplanoides sp. SCSIO 12839]